jgi:hypothetical protein
MNREDGSSSYASKVGKMRIWSLALLAGCASPVQLPPTISVVIRSSGDDGLSQRLELALERAFSASTRFTLAEGSEKPDLVVTVPENVDWKQRGKRVTAVYRVQFSAERPLARSSSSGNCPEDALDLCARRIVSDASAALQEGAR